MSTDWVRPNTILLGEFGSGAQGTATADSDTDQIGIAIEPAEYIIGLGRFDQATHRGQDEHVASKPGDVEGVTYSLRKWARLASEGSPNLLSAVYLPQYDILTPAGEKLVNNREMFLSKITAGRYLGYLMDQRNSLLGLKSAKKHRPELVSKYGFDTKYAYHMLRVGIQGMHLLTTGHLPMPLVGDELSLLRAVRAGKVSLDECITLAGQYETELEALKSSSILPDTADLTAIDALLVSMYQAHWAA